MKKILITTLLLSFSLTTEARKSHKPKPRSNDGPALTCSEAKQYSQILAKMSNYALYCDLQKDSGGERSQTLATKYAEKHQEWRSLDRRAFIPFEGENKFDSYNTKQYNIASKEFISFRDGVAASGDTEAVAGVGGTKACEQRLDDFNQLASKSTTELLSYIRELPEAQKNDDDCDNDNVDEID